MGPLALMAKAAGFMVWGSDLAKGAIYDELVKAGIEVKIGPQDGEFLREKLEKKDLIRVVKNNEGIVSIDETGKANGRGAYLKKSIETFLSCIVRRKSSAQITL